MFKFTYKDNDKTKKSKIFKKKRLKIIVGIISLKCNE